MDHGRLHWFVPSELDEKQHEVYEQIVGGPRAQQARTTPLTDAEGRLHGPFNALLVDPVLGELIQKLGSALRFEISLPPRSREIATLIVAKTMESNFEWYAHAKLGSAAGLSDDEISAILDSRSPLTFSPQEALIDRIVRTLLSEPDLDDVVFKQAHDELGRVTLMDLIVLVGYYQLLSRILEVWHTPLPEGGIPQFAK